MQHAVGCLQKRRRIPRWHRQRRKLDQPRVYIFRQLLIRPEHPQSEPHVVDNVQHQLGQVVVGRSQPHSALHWTTIRAFISCPNAQHAYTLVHRFSEDERRVGLVERARRQLAVVKPLTTRRGQQVRPKQPQDLVGRRPFGELLPVLGHVSVHLGVAHLQHHGGGSDDEEDVVAEPLGPQMSRPVRQINAHGPRYNFVSTSISTMAIIAQGGDN